MWLLLEGLAGDLIRDGPQLDESSKVYLELHYPPSTNVQRYQMKNHAVTTVGIVKIVEEYLSKARQAYKSASPSNETRKAEELRPKPRVHKPPPIPSNTRFRQS